MNLLNRTAVKRHALEISKAKGRKFTMVSKAFVDQLEAGVRNMLEARVHSARGGKTLRP